MGIHGVFIGIDTYMDSNVPGLQCAAKDAEVLHNMFESIGAATTLLLNTRATATAIRRAIYSLARSVAHDDTAILYFSGHGARDSLRLRNTETRQIPLLLPYDTLVEDLAATAISMEEIGRFFELIPCRNVVFFFDSCYSGAAASSRTFLVPGTRAIDMGNPIMPDITGEGRIILAASEEYKPAYEDPSSGHGIFTEYLIEALTGHASPNEDGSVSLSAIFTHLQAKVPEKTKRKYNNIQRPIQHGTIVQNVSFPIIHESPSRTLAGFPYMFLPMTVIIGDRREPEPKTRGDLFALSASSADLRWILALGLSHDTEILSDKVFRNAKEDYLVERFGRRNLLIIGSPASNHLARVVNETAFFSFNIDPEVRSETVKIYKEIDQIGNDRVRLVNYALDPRVREALRFYMNQLKQGGFIDPTYNYIRRGDTIPYDRDYGVISICRNPFTPSCSSDFIAILAGGVHLPGTMYALYLLSRPRDEFTSRPLGGVFNVQLTETDWVKRLELATPQWSTEPYTFLDMQSALSQLKTKLDYARGLSEASIDDRINFVEQLYSG